MWDWHKKVPSLLMLGLGSGDFTGFSLEKAGWSDPYGNRYVLWPTSF